MGCFHIEAFRAERRDVGQSEVIPESHCLFSTLSSCPPPLLPPSPHPQFTLAFTGKTCGSWQARQLERGHGTTLLSTAPSQFSPRPNGGIWKLGRAMKEQACGNMSGKMQGLRMRRRNCSLWKGCQDFLHQQNQERQSIECQAKLREASLEAGRGR